MFRSYDLLKTRVIIIKFSELRFCFTFTQQYDISHWAWLNSIVSYDLDEVCCISMDHALSQLTPSHVLSDHMTGKQCTERSCHLRSVFTHRCRLKLTNWSKTEIRSGPDSVSDVKFNHVRLKHTRARDYFCSNRSVQYNQCVFNRKWNFCRDCHKTIMCIYFVKMSS